MPDDKKILIIEDDKFLSEMYATKLKEAGFEVEAAYDGEEGIYAAEEFNPDLILLDIVLPKMDGFEVMQKIRKNAGLKNIIIIALTNLGQKEEVEKGLALGANDYAIKAHFTPTEVVTKVKKLLNQ
ncbi:MAG: Response regulator receiver [Parcubacteria group bacterium GW2011_GWA2_42_11]|nr:MAG: Response regulator receiver [Parcubacteria group bacterium GW2011_GWA2_42_11]